MKNRIILCVIIGMFFSVSVKAQFLFGLSITPPNPNPTDYIEVIAESMFPYGGCPLVAYNVSVNGPLIDVFAYHQMGALTVICVTKDTLPIGNLAPGNYTLAYTVVDISTSNSTSDTIYFTVSTPTDIASLEVMTQISIIAQNGNIILKDAAILQDNNTYRIFITDMQGRIVFQTDEEPGNGSLSITSRTLTSGLYLVSIADAENIRYKKKVAISE